MAQARPLWVWWGSRLSAFAPVFPQPGWGRLVPGVSGRVRCWDEPPLPLLLTALGREARWRLREPCAASGAGEREAIAPHTRRWPSRPPRGPARARRAGGLARVTTRGCGVPCGRRRSGPTTGGLGAHAGRAWSQAACCHPRPAPSVLAVLGGVVAMPRGPGRPGEHPATPGPPLSSRREGSLKSWKPLYNSTSVQSDPGCARCAVQCDHGQKGGGGGIGWDRQPLGWHD